MQEAYTLESDINEIIVIPKDDDGFRVFIEEHLAVMQAVARQYENAQPPEDTVQESLLKAWLYEKPLYGNNAQPWLTTITANTGRDAYRKTLKRHKTTPVVDTTKLAEDLPSDDSVDETALARDGIALILQVIDEQTASSPALDARDLVEHIFIQGMSHADYAALRGISIMTVRTRLSRIRKKLDANDIRSVVRGETEISA